MKQESSQARLRKREYQVHFHNVEIHKVTMETSPFRMNQAALTFPTNDYKGCFWQKHHFVQFVFIVYGVSKVIFQVKAKIHMHMHK